jgi:hypothetical protein
MGGEEPLDEHLFDGGGGVELGVEGVAEVVEGGGVLIGQDGGIGKDAVLAGVEAGDGLTLGGFGAGAEPGVAAIGFDLAE